LKTRPWQAACRFWLAFECPEVLKKIKEPSRPQFGQEGLARLGELEKIARLSSAERRSASARQSPPRSFPAHGQKALANYSRIKKSDHLLKSQRDFKFIKY